MSKLKMEPGYNNMAKYWCFTLNNWTPEEEHQIQYELTFKDACDYVVYGREIGENETPHLQGFFCLRTKKRLATLKKFLNRAHLEVKSKKSTMKQASDYCKKEGNFWEWGTLPEDSTSKGLKVIAENYDETVELAKQGRIDEIGAEHLLKYYPTIKKIQNDNKKMPSNLDWTTPPNIWIWGPTGTGKSYRAREILGDKFYTKIAANKWWDKYNGEDGVLIEDMDVTHSYMGYYLKIWADKYAFSVEVKCSGDLIRPKVIIVTSNYPIDMVFPDKSIHQPLLRRFQIIHMEHPWNATINDVLKWQDVGEAKNHEKKRKFDQPLPRPSLLRRDAHGDLVPWKQTQKVMDEFIEDPRTGQDDPYESSSDDLIEI